MGAFPALMIKPPEPVLQQYAQAQQVVGGQQEQQLRALQIQQEQQKITDQHAMTAGMANWDGKDYSQLPGLIKAAGGSAAAVMGVTKSVFDIKAKASEVAKDDSITAQNNTKAIEEQHDALRGRVMSVVGIADPAEKQAKWDEEVTKEEQAGTVKPGQFPHQYPGDAPATALANSFALGSTLAKEAQERQKLALDGWKSAGGALVNVIDGSKIGGLQNITQLNKGLETRWQVLHPSETLPDNFQLSATATPADFERVDKLLEATEKGAATKAQQEVVNAMRQQTFEMQRDKTDMQAVVGLDPKSGQQVLLPAGQAQQAGIQNPMKADADMVNKALAARHWLNLANKQGDAKAAPEDMGIMQLVDKLDSEGKLGPIASRWNEFMTGKVGAGDPEVAALRAKMGLSTTLLMQAHVGSRGSAQMLEHFEDLANQKKLDGPTLKAALGAEVSYVQDKAMDPNPPSYGKPAAKSGTTPSTTAKPPEGATHKVPGPDGKMHYTNAAGTVDLGVAP
jgi:hypothetical protein